MNLKITFHIDEHSRLKGIIFLVLSILFILIATFGSINANQVVLLLFLFLISMFTFSALISLKPLTVFINKDFFTVGRFQLFQQKYFWKDIEKIHNSGGVDGDNSNSYSPYVIIELAKRNIQAPKKAKDRKKILFGFCDDFGVEMEVALIELLSFFSEHYAYVDIHTPEIDRPEVQSLANKLSKPGVTCEFNSTVCLNLILSSNKDTKVKGVGFGLFFLLLLFLFFTKFDTIIENPPFILWFLGFSIMSLMIAWFSLMPLTIVIDKNYFTIGRTKLYKQKYFWKNIKKIRKHVWNDEKSSDNFSPYLTLEFAQESENIFISSRKDFGKDRNEALLAVLSFFQEHYSDSDIHTPEIDRPEVKALTEKLRKFDIVCKFSC